MIGVSARHTSRQRRMIWKWALNPTLLSAVALALKLRRRMLLFTFPSQSQASKIHHFTDHCPQNECSLKTTAVYSEIFFSNLSSFKAFE